MAIKEIFESNTDKIDLATELLSEFSDREGQYVWKKWEVTETVLTNPSIVLTGSLATGVSVTSANVDLSKVNESFFEGFTLGNNVFTYNANGDFVYSNEGVEYAASWDKEQKLLFIPTRGSAFSNHTFTYTGNKTVYLLSETTSFVTSDDSSAYPNDGVQDGGWYLKVENYSDDNPLTIGENGATIEAGTLFETALQILSGVEAGVPLPAPFTKYIVREFTMSSRAAGTTAVTHGLGTIPKLVLLIGKTTSTTSYDMFSYCITDWGQTGNGSVLIGYYYSVGSSTPHRYEKKNATLTSSAVSSIGDSGYYYAKGVTYTLIAFA